MPGIDPSAVHRAVADIFQRTLSGVHDDLGKLICIASTRDYNTGEYHHAGLAAAFSDEVASKALATCHRELFQTVSRAPIRQLVRQLEGYVQSTGAPETAVLESWSDLQPYRVVVPAECEKLSAELFFSNVKIALAILRSRRSRRGESPRSSSPPQSLVR